MCILSDLCSCDYLKCFAGKEQQRWDRSTLLFGLCCLGELSINPNPQTLLRRERARPGGSPNAASDESSCAVRLPPAAAFDILQLKSARRGLACR